MIEQKNQISDISSSTILLCSGITCIWWVSWRERPWFPKGQIEGQCIHVARRRTESRPWGGVLSSSSAKIWPHYHIQNKRHRVKIEFEGCVERHLPVRIESVRIGPDIGIVVDLPDGDLDVGSGWNVVVPDLSVAGNFPGDHEDDRWIHPQSFADDLVQINQLAQHIEFQILANLYSNYLLNI